MSGDAADSSASSPADRASKTEEGARTAAVGSYTWRDFMAEYGYADEIEEAYRDVDSGSSSTTVLPDRLGGNGHAEQNETLGWLPTRLRSLVASSTTQVPTDSDWERVEFDPETYLGFPTGELESRLGRGGARASSLRDQFETWLEDTPVTKDEYTWDHFKREYYYESDGSRPRDIQGNVRAFEPEEYLGFDPDNVESVLASASDSAETLGAIEDRRTVDVASDIDEDAFFTTADGHTTLVNRYDLEKAVPMAKKRHFTEVERYWVNKPYAFIIIFYTSRENEKKYYVVDPYLNDIERKLIEFYSGKLRISIKYSDDDSVVRGTDEGRGQILEEETKWLMDRHNLRKAPSNESRLWEGIKQLFGLDSERDGVDGATGSLDGIEARPEPVVLAEDLDWLTEYQVTKLLHVIRRDFVGYERIDPIKHDINVEDISCDGYDSPVFVYHTDYENLITNVEHGSTRLDNFVIKLAQRSGKGISKRQPQVDATLPDGSRAQLTLGEEVSDHGTNYTIRQFKDVPFTPVDLINWKTFSLNEMAFLWLCIESNKSLIFAGGTASGKTTSLNAVSLFIPSNAKIVSIEDTREVELPQRNWVASVTRPSFSQDNVGDVDEFDLLEAALRQRPDYIVMGEVRGEEGRTLFQVMSTGHTTYTTFHADTVDEVIKRFTTDPINVSKTLFTALDLVSVQTQTKVQGEKVRRNKMITEINSYDAENEEISVQDIFQWQPNNDEFLQHGTSQKLQEIAFDRGWSQEQLEMELFKRQTILSYLVTNGLNTYTEVAATLQAFINDPETILALIADGKLEQSLENLRNMESVLIDVDPKEEALVPRPEPDQETIDRAERVLEEAEDRVFEDYRGTRAGGVAEALATVTPADDVTTVPEDRTMLESVEAAAESEERPTAERPEPAAEEGDAPDSDPGSSPADDVTSSSTEGGPSTEEE